MSEQLTLKQEKKAAKKCAKDLGYSQECIEEIEQAKSGVEIDRILKKYRKLKYG